MSRRIRLLTVRRELLTAQNAVQRLELALHWHAIRRSTNLAERAAGVVAYLRERPFVIIGVAAALAAFKPRRVLRWVVAGLKGWLLLRRR